MALRARIERPSVAKMGRSREGDDAKHIDMIRKLPCAVYGIPGPSDPHHLMRVEGGKRGTAMTNEDRYAIPLSRRAHNMVHLDKRAIELGEEAYLASLGIDGRGLAAALWACRGEGLPAYERVLFRSLQSRGIHLV